MINSWNCAVSVHHHKRWIFSTQTNHAETLKPNLLCFKAAWWVIFDCRPIPTWTFQPKIYCVKCRTFQKLGGGGCQEGYCIKSSEWHLYNSYWVGRLRYPNKGLPVSCLWVFSCQMKLSPCPFLMNVWGDVHTWDVHTCNCENSLRRSSEKDAWFKQNAYWLFCWSSVCAVDAEGAVWM